MGSLTDKQNIQWFPGHMMKTLRQIEADIGGVDVVLTLLDARIPFSSMNPEIEKRTATKPRLYILSKADLADAGVTNQWLNTLRTENTRAVAINSKSKGGVEKVKKEIDAALSELLANRAQKGMVGAKTRVMVCGIPNVGKSTFINTFAGGNRAKTANRPGVTRGKQWVAAGSYDLLDMPGVLWPKFTRRDTAYNLAFIGSIKEDLLDVTEITAALIGQMRVHYAPALCERYKIAQDEFDNLENYEVLEKIARARGMLLSGAEPDLERAATMLLGEFRACKLGRISLERPGEISNEEPAV